MMKSTGRQWLPTWLALCGLLFAAQVNAELSASVDRDRVSLGDTLRLTITATGGEDVNALDLRPLEADFEVLGRSSSSNTTISNGKRTHLQQLLLDIAPKRQGTLRVPPLRAGGAATNLLLISVGPAPKGSTTGQNVIFEAEVDRRQVYVQGQVLLTLRLQQAINLDDRSIGQLELDGAFVVPLEQNSFQRTRDGRPWLVHEVRYAIFPEQSGTLEIPAQTFSARERQPRRSFFDMGGGGPLIRRRTEALRIEVMPRPDSFPGTTWLPARNLTVEESWSVAPEQLRAGESATRTLTLRGEGLQGAQLPPVLFPATEGIKYYPDQPAIENNETGSGLVGTRRDSVAMVPTQAGSLTIPEIRIPWWDTAADQLRYAVIPAREITVAPADISIAAPPLAATSLAPEGNIPLRAATDKNSALVWQVIAGASTLGWLLTLLYLFFRRGRPASGGDESRENPSEQRAFKQLLAACASGSGVHARQALVDWSAALFPHRTVVSLKQVGALFANEELQRELDALNDALYGRAAQRWQGDRLAQLAKELRQQQRRDSRRSDTELRLYPRAA